MLQEDGSGTQRRLPPAGHSTEWLQGDAGLATAIASCMAADVKCKVIPVGPLPSSQARHPPLSKLLDIPLMVAWAARLMPCQQHHGTTQVY